MFSLQRNYVSLYCTPLIYAVIFQSKIKSFWKESLKIENKDVQCTKKHKLVQTNGYRKEKRVT